ncbi:MAG: hypothetical protein M1818_003660 [Claussenomyces sp. TS43310]|nr:MAG: hypothetical protein M1818_003660 [Claussenomyces sp. TS43310]
MAPPGRLVRRKPWAEKIKAYLDPLDFLLWLSEEIETGDWDTKSFGTPLGLTFSFVFLLARANSGVPGTSKEDDVFGDSRHGSGWLRWFAAFLVHVLLWISLLNAFYTFYRKRHYRLFENSVDVAPSTLSAHRVKVDSSPVASSPLRLLTNIIAETSAESRSHPDPTRDVWELAVWDPLPVCLRLFCLFSPGHVLVYFLFLPISSLDPRPSITVVTTITLQVLLSAQLLLLQSNFSQQAKDTSVIHKEVLNEYDTKFVHPRTNPPVRDVGTQFTSSAAGPGLNADNKVDTYTPTTILRRGFKTNPNPNYAKHISPENTSLVPKREAFTPLSAFKTPGPAYVRRQSTPLNATPAAIRQPQFRQSMQGSTGISISSSSTDNDGGSLGIYSHANSPLKKASSMYDMYGGRRETPRNSFQAAQREIAEERERERERERSRSPVKRPRDDGPQRSVLPRFGGDPHQRSRAYY